MSKTTAEGKINQNQPDYEASGDLYVIRLKGYLDSCWTEWFDNLTMSHTSSGETILAGPIVDQAALHGLLAKIRDLNLTLVSVNRTGTGFTHRNSEEKP